MFNVAKRLAWLWISKCLMGLGYHRVCSLSCVHHLAGTSPPKPFTGTKTNYIIGFFSLSERRVELFQDWLSSNLWVPGQGRAGWGSLLGSPFTSFLFPFKEGDGVGLQVFLSVILPHLILSLPLFSLPTPPPPTPNTHLHCAFILNKRLPKNILWGMGD